MPPLAAMVRMVAGDRLPVVSLLPPGRSPHDFEPTPSEVDRIRRAVLFVDTGGDADRWMRRSARAVVGDSARELAMTAVSPDPGYDPHLWLNLEVVERFIPMLAESLAAVDPGGTAGYRARGTAALDSLRAFDAWARQALAPVKDVPFALLHPAFEDFVRRYDLDLVSILQIQPEGELLPRSLGNVVDILTRSGAKVIFAEPQLSARGAEAVAHETGARVEMLDPLGGPDLPGRETYLELLRWNARSLAEQLGAAKP